MIVISGVLVVLALVLLIAGVLADSLPMIYLSIATSAVSFLSLVFGVRQRKDEQVPGSATAVSASSRSTEVRSGGSVALLERPDAPPAPERSAPPTLADTAVVGGPRGSAPVEHPAAGTGRPDDREADTAEHADGPSAEPSAPHVAEAEQEPASDALEEYDDEEYDDYEGYEEEATEGVVLVINGRPRYHVEDCRFVAGKDAEAIAVEDAREEGFTACGVCRPDEALAAAAELYEDEDEEYDEDEPVDAAEESDEVEEPDTAGGAPVAGPRDLAVVPGVTAVADAPVREQHADDELAEYADTYDEYDDEEYAEADEDGYAGPEDGAEPEFEEAYEDEAEPVQVGGPPAVAAGPAAEVPVLEDPTLEDQPLEYQPLEDPALEDDLLEDDEDLAEPAAAATVPPLEPEPVVPPAPPRARRMAAAGEAATGARPSPRRTAGARPAGGRPGATRRPSRAAAPSPVPDEVPAPPPRTSTRGRVVVIPDRGRYHRPECRYVRDSPDAIEITKNRANKQGYVPCGVCKP